MGDPGFLEFSAALFGLITGSFLNVCISRLPDHLSVVSPRSHCPTCQHSIAWYDNIPVLSFFLLRMRCRHCGARISWRYIVVELATSVLFFGVVYAFGFAGETVKWLIFGCLMLTLAFTDAETQLLPDVLTIGGMVVGLLLSLVVPLYDPFTGLLLGELPQLHLSFLNAASGALALSVPFAIFGFAYARFRKILPPGWGDVKLLAMMGSFLGTEQGLVASIVGMVSGAVIGLGYIVGTGKNPRLHTLPLGTFLCGAGILISLWGPQITAWYWNRGF
jgi:leader peptidase (prepilin peptidase) / N-methyltransferase